MYEIRRNSIPTDNAERFNGEGTQLSSARWKVRKKGNYYLTFGGHARAVRPDDPVVKIAVAVGFKGPVLL